MRVFGNKNSLIVSADSVSARWITFSESSCATQRQLSDTLRSAYSAWRWHAVYGHWEGVGQNARRLVLELHAGYWTHATESVFDLVRPFGFAKCPHRSQHAESGVQEDGLELSCPVDWAMAGA